MPGQPSNPAFVTLDATNLIPHDQDGQPSGLVITRAAGMILHLDINVGGTWAIFLSGDAYKVEFYYESIGTGPEGTLTSVVGNLPAAFPATQTVHSPLVNGAALPADGVYKLAAVVSMTGAPPAVAFVEGPVIQITT